ncbi:MAG: hypothetical protein DRJ42_25130 [Deltaproteobacteria bacterium]|nr:MAG: hypothetical protein DRJ42_25130 [Deltaproteobacteria bacterium]
MSGPRYPLEAARTVRSLAVDEAEAKLAGASAALTEAVAAVEAARESARAHALESEAEDTERRRREDLGASAAEMLRALSFGGRRQREGEALGVGLRKAEVEQEEAERVVAGARRALAAANADREVVERHHQDFRKRQKDLQEARDEAEAEDLATARRHHERE